MTKPLAHFPVSIASAPSRALISPTNCRVHQIQCAKLHTSTTCSHASPNPASGSLEHNVASLRSSETSESSVKGRAASFARLTASFHSTPTPTAAQLNYASNFFTKSRPKYLLSSAKFRQLPVSDIPEVCFLGRSNVGKSSLLNALVHRTGMELANVSRRPGRTRTMNAFGIGNVQVLNRPPKSRAVHRAQREKQKEGQSQDKATIPETPAPEQYERWTSVGGPGLVVLDMPGYGKASREAWGMEAIKYLRGRQQLRRTFLLLDAEHGVKDTDLHMLSILRKAGIPHQVVLSKVDKLIVPTKRVTAVNMLRRVEEQLPRLFASVRQSVTSPGLSPSEREGVPTLDDIITVSSEVAFPLGSSNKIGIDNLRWAVLAATGLDCDELGNKRPMLDFRIQSSRHDEDENDGDALPKRQQHRIKNRDAPVTETSFRNDEEVISWEEIERRQQAH